jgi:uncharacterized protein YxjI
MFEQKWFAITERIKAKPIKKDFNVFIDKIRGEEYMNGNIIKNSYKIKTKKSYNFKMQMGWCSVLSWAATLSLALKPQRK